jgi:hypothetical protein
MAKRRGKGKQRGSDQLNATLEGIGTALGQAAARLDAWKKQRAEIAADLQRILGSAHRMLGDVGASAGRHTTTLLQPAKNRGGRPKGYKMSAATKAKLRAAWKRRKAAAKSKAATA